MTQAAEAWPDGVRTFDDLAFDVLMIEGSRRRHALVQLPDFAPVSFAARFV